MAPRKEMNRTSGVARRKAPLDKYTNITNAATVRGLIRSGGPITGSASGVRSISSVDAFNTLGQFFVGEALGIGLAAGAAKVFGFAAPKIGRALSGARPMTVAERSAAVTRAGRTGVGKIGRSTKPEGMYDGGLPYPSHAWDTYDSGYDQVYRQARTIVDNRNTRAMAGRPGVRTPDTVLDVTGDPRYKGYTWDNSGVNPFTDEFEVQNLIPAYLKKTLDWKATRAPLRRTASTKKRDTKR